MFLFKGTPLLKSALSRDINHVYTVNRRKDRDSVMIWAGSSGSDEILSVRSATLSSHSFSTFGSLPVLPSSLNEMRRLPKQLPSALWSRRTWPSSSSFWRSIPLSWRLKQISVVCCNTRATPATQVRPRTPTHPEL